VDEKTPEELEGITTIKMRKHYTRTSKAKDLKNKMSPWYGIHEKDITYCKKCGVKIWTKWLVRKPWEKNEEMDLCGPCYFKTKIL